MTATKLGIHRVSVFGAHRDVRGQGTGDNNEISLSGGDDVDFSQLWEVTCNSDAVRLFSWLLADVTVEEVVFTAVNLENKGYAKRDRRTIRRFSKVTWQRQDRTTN